MKYLLRHLPFVVLILFTFFCATFRLSESPKTWYDEGMFMQVARNLSSGGYFFRTAPDELISAGIYTTVGYPVIYSVWILFQLFGVSVLVARIAMVPFMLLVVAASYGFIRRAWGSRAALFASALIATHPPLYGNGKNVLGEVPGMAFFFLFLFALTELQKKQWKGRLCWIVTGASAGLFCASKPNFLSFGIVLILIASAYWRRVRSHWRDGLFGAIAWAIPVVWFFVAAFGPNPLTWVAAFQTYTHLPGLADVAGSSGIALALTNAKRFFTESSPILFALTSLVWFASVIQRILKRTRIAVPEVIAISFVCFTVLYFLRMPAFYRYLLPAQLVIYAFLPAAGLELARQKRILRMAWCSLLAALCVFQLYQLAFNSWVQKYYSGTKTAELQTFARTISPSQTIFFYNALDLASIVPTENYFQYFPGALLKRSVGASSLVRLKAGEPDIAVVPIDVIEEARPYLEKYEENGTVTAAGYRIFQRRSL